MVCVVVIAFFVFVLYYVWFCSCYSVGRDSVSRTVVGSRVKVKFVRENFSVLVMFFVMNAFISRRRTVSCVWLVFCFSLGRVCWKVVWLSLTLTLATTLAVRAAWTCVFDTPATAVPRTFTTKYR